MHGFTSVEGTNDLVLARVEINRDPGATTPRGRRLDARSVSFRGNWRRNAERATLDRNYVLCILLEQAQHCEMHFSRAPRPDGFLFRINVGGEARNLLPICFIGCAAGGFATFVAVWPVVIEGAKFARETHRARS
jgi:hypothetical protein